MRHLKSYKLFESSDQKLMVNYYKQAEDIRKKFSDDMDVLDNKFIADLKDCMHDLTDRQEWVVRDESNGLFFWNYIFKIPHTDYKDFTVAFNDSLSKLDNYLGIEYDINLITDFKGSPNSGKRIEIKNLEEFNKHFYRYKSLYYKKDIPLIFEVRIGREGK